MRSLLAIDVGAGTQDILLYRSDQPMENCVKMVLPSPTVLVSKKIREAAELGKDITLRGTIMGGGPCVGAIKEHLKKGLKVYATPKAALTIADNLANVEAMGILITSDPPKQNTVNIELKDLDIPTLSKALASYHVELPSEVAVAVQDHGHCPTGSNRKFRFQHWEQFMLSGGQISELCYQEVPSYFTRMKAIQETYAGAILMDTGAAAIWGALADPVVMKYKENGFMAVNLGNQHTLGIFLQGDRIWGLFEHHTRLLTVDKVIALIRRLAEGSLINEDVYHDGGHGAYIHPQYRPYNKKPFVAILGPQRHLLRDKVSDKEFYMAAPYGDMMLAGCFGLVAASGFLPIQI
ncbi:MAG: DUF1786 domain-containing protein [Candidatus Tectomicrobia bacterium]|uniref:DUF1786 domain-containing protein n=1 Tax=Tectimicrobiota bacterium TaxID=2528274 RepID=A0A933LQV7_UNCTE|nr:DUF1786 domain-containing protein [Candidatus Tectomicrobia bacterium]